MDSIKEGLKESLRKAGSGYFQPYSYLIGLENGDKIDDHLMAIENYPIPEDLIEERLKYFGNCLLFIHEMTHISQFISTSYGLRTMRQTLITASRIARGPKRKIPILKNLDFKNEEDMKDLERYLFFIDNMDQYKIHMGQSEINNQSIPDCWFEDWSLSYYILGNFNPTDQDKDLIKKNGGVFYKIPHLTVCYNSNYIDIVLNTAVLMEAYAVLIEFSHIQIAFNNKFNLMDMIEFMPQSYEYCAVIIYALKNRVCGAEDLLKLLVLIDISLMYDPFILYNSTPFSDQKENQEVYPGYTFIKCCEVSKEINLTVTNSNIHIYYEQVCNKMNFPSHKEMAMKSYEVSKTILEKASENTLMYKALNAHCSALKHRVLNTDEYPFFHTKRVSLNIYNDMLRGVACYYDISKQKPITSYYEKIDILTLHNILIQALSSEKTFCPLKYGIPFYCDSKSWGEDLLCDWKPDLFMNECIVDYIDKFIAR